MSEILHTTATAARAAEISEATLRLWARLGLVPSQVTSNGMRLFALADVLRVADERRANRRRVRSIA
jgi:DNA-binding transcriptional MerR regulator